MFFDMFCRYFSFGDFVEEVCILNISFIIEVKVFKNGVIVLVIFFMIVVNVLLLIFLVIIFLVRRVGFCVFISLVKKYKINIVCNFWLIFIVLWIKN